MKIKKLLSKINIKNTITNDHIIGDLQNNSNDCHINDVFFSINSYSSDENYIDAAIKNGARTIIHEGIVEKNHPDVNYIKVIDVRKCMGILTSYFYKNVTKKIKLIGVTGTNGKTTVTNIIYDYLCYEGYESMLIGTSGIFFQDNHYDSNNTTPDILFTTKIIKHALDKKLKYVVMEVSSIGIRELRVMGFDFDYVILTNVTHDHLDYHKNMEDYKFSKGLLINSIPNKKNKCIILNRDIESFSFYNKLSSARVITYGINNSSDYQAINIVKNINETNFRLLTSTNKYIVKTALIGGFNVYNILCCVALIKELGFKVIKFIEFLKIYANINGRMDIIKYNNRTIVVDFAHTPDGVSNALRELKEYNSSKLTVIIGCGGCRDKLKRAVIGEIACQYADKIIFTNDNPRDELPENIIKDITSNIKSQKYEVIYDRKQAIYTSLDTSIKDEIIAILGKGSETYQIIMGIKYPFNDKEVVREYIREH